MPTEGSQFIEARDVIEVAVSVEDGINFKQAFAKCLLAEVRATVYQDRTLGGVQVERGSGSLTVVLKMFARISISLSCDNVRSLCDEVVSQLAKLNNQCAQPACSTKRFARFWTGTAPNERLVVRAITVEPHLKGHVSFL